MYESQVLEVYSMPVLYDWVESGSFGYCLEVKAVLATYTSFFDVFIDLFGFRKDLETTCLWISDWMNFTWMLYITFHPFEN